MKEAHAYLFASESGQVMVEYMIVTVLVCIGLAFALYLFGNAFRNIFYSGAFLWSLPFP